MSFLGTALLLRVVLKKKFLQDQNAKRSVLDYNVLDVWNALLLPRISPIKAFAFRGEIDIKTPLFLYIAAYNPSGRFLTFFHFEMFDGFPRSQVQFPDSFDKPICHTFVLQPLRF